MQKVMQWKEKDLAMNTCPRIFSSQCSRRIQFCAYFAVLSVLSITPGAFSQDIILSVADIDFRQAANLGPPVGTINWINSILQQNNSVYFEGISVPQRTIFLDFEEEDGNEHSLTFSHQVSKGTIHAYDYMTSWAQAKAAGLVIAPPPDDILLDLFTSACGPNIGPQASIVICNNLLTSGFSITADIPGGAADPMGMVNGHDVDASADAYELVFGNRVLTIHGNAAFSAANLAFTGYTGGSDKFANYRLTWTSASDQIFIDVAGHLSVGIDNGAGAGIGYGVGLGAAAISGGPYHFKLKHLDDESLGSQDNQIKGADIFIPFCTAGATDPGGKCDDGLECTIDTCDEAGDSCIHTPDSGLCNDNNVCTDDVCSPIKGCMFTPDDSNSCSDGDFCNGLELCIAGSCVAGSDPCDDGIACTIDSCDEVNDVCTNSPDDFLCPSDGNPCTDEVCVAGVGCTIVNDDSNICSDGAFCNGLELCVVGVCLAGSDPCEDGVACTVDVCDEINDSCTNSPNDNLCDNGIFCDGPETCNSVTDCQSGAAIDCSSFTDQCNLGVCNEALLSCVASPQNENAACDDGLFCNTGEVCINGACGGGSTLSCDDGVTCTNDSCDEATDQCVNTPDDTICDNGLFCDGDEFCDLLFDCQPSTGDPCAAVAGLKCSETSNTCVACTSNAQCDDGNECTENLCLSEVCVTNSIAAGTPCTDDGVACTINACDGAGNCSATTDDTLCVDDGNICTDEVCDLSLGCIAVNNNNLCDDGSFCTINDVCTAGDCVGTARSCDDGIACTIDSCNDIDDICENNTDDTLCPSDGNLCTDEVCIAGVGCTIISDDSNVCDDGEFCNGDEICFGGACLPGVNPCDDGVDCTIDSCDEINDVCNFSPDNAACIDDGNPCTDEVCDSILGCLHLNNVDFCDDGLFCTVGDVCTNGECVGVSRDCDDGIACTIEHCDEQADACIITPENSLCNDQNLCTDDACVVGTGCVFTPDDTNSCDDGKFCNGPETCTDGQCQSGSQDCSDGVSCTFDECDEANDLCVNTPDNSVCTSDGTFCNGIEICDLINDCVSSGNPCGVEEVCCEGAGTCELECCGDADCDDSNLCSTDTCVAGACVFEPVVCDSDGSFCNGEEVCDQATGLCVSPGSSCSDPTGLCCEADDTCAAECCADSECNDNSKCTTDACVLGSCVFTPISCPDDLNFCNGVESCNPAIGCVSSGNPCNGTGLKCSESTDACVECLFSGHCNDNNNCTFDTCNSNNDCDHLPQCGACCLEEGSCTDGITPNDCISLNGTFRGVESTCQGDGDGDGRDDLCVPAVSTWGMIILLLLLLTGLTIRFDRSRVGIERP